jgi:hypothetical protein
MTRPLTQAERLTRIETLLGQALLQRQEDRESMREKIDAMAKDIKDIKTDLEKDKAELATLKDKGSGILIGVGLAGGAIGASISAIIKALQEIFK